MSWLCPHGGSSPSGVSFSDCEPRPCNLQTFTAGHATTCISQVPVVIEFFARLIRKDEDLLLSPRPVRLVCYERSNGRAVLAAHSRRSRPRLVGSGCAVIYFTTMGALL